MGNVYKPVGRLVLTEEERIQLLSEREILSEILIQLKELNKNIENLGGNKNGN